MLLPLIETRRAPSEVEGDSECVVSRTRRS
jgi:hypothetical protein